MRDCVEKKETWAGHLTLGTDCLVITFIDIHLFPPTIASYHSIPILYRGIRI